MDFTKLETHVIDVLKEEQIKLGFRKEAVRLYYPLTSLNRLLSVNLNAEEMMECLQGFVVYEKERLGALEISCNKDRFCFQVPPEGAEYVHTCWDETAFLYQLVKTIEKHGCTIEEVLNLFHQYSEQVHVEVMQNEEFDYLVYFENGEPDPYRYCLTNEGCHVIYHRFTVEDYEDLFIA